MDRESLQEILRQHERWLEGEGGDGRQADLRGVDLRGEDLHGVILSEADLSEADLRGTNLTRTDLSEAILRGVDLSRADLTVTNLCGADLREAVLDLASFPLWCGSFNVVADDRLVWQLVAHITRLHTEQCSEDVRQLMEALAPWADRFCKYRPDVRPINPIEEDSDDND